MDDAAPGGSKKSETPVPGKSPRSCAEGGRGEGRETAAAGGETAARGKGGDSSIHPADTVKKGEPAAAARHGGGASHAHVLRTRHRWSVLRRRARSLSGVMNSIRWCASSRLVRLQPGLPAGHLWRRALGERHRAASSGSLLLDAFRVHHELGLAASAVGGLAVRLRRPGGRQVDVAHRADATGGCGRRSCSSGGAKAAVALRREGRAAVEARRQVLDGVLVLEGVESWRLVRGDDDAGARGRFGDRGRRELGR